MSTCPRSVIMTLSLAGLLVALLALGGCKAEECQQMTECCAAVADVPGVGSSCGELAEQTRDPDTCRTILRTVRYMYEDRDGDPPPACRKKSTASTSEQSTSTEGAEKNDG